MNHLTRDSSNTDCVILKLHAGRLLSNVISLKTRLNNANEMKNWRQTNIESEHALFLVVNKSKWEDSFAAHDVQERSTPQLRSTTLR